MRLCLRSRGKRRSSGRYTIISLQYRLGKRGGRGIEGNSCWTGAFLWPNWHDIFSGKEGGSLVGNNKQGCNKGDAPAGGCKAHNGQADEGNERVADEDGAADVVVVTQVGGGHHKKGGKSVLGKEVSFEATPVRTRSRSWIGGCAEETSVKGCFPVDDVPGVL